MATLDPSLLKDVPAFRDMDAGQIRGVLDLAQPKRHDDGAAIFSAGKEATRFFLLLDGLIRVVRADRSGEQIIVLHIASGELFGIAQALGHNIYPATALAAGECLTLSWPMARWEEFFQRHPGFRDTSRKIVGQRMGELQERILRMSTQQVEQRVAAALLRLLNQSAEQTPDGILITVPITRRDIAELTGTTLHTVSRLLSRWEKDDIVKSARRRILVRDAHKLLLISENRT